MSAPGGNTRLVDEWERRLKGMAKGARNEQLWYGGLAIGIAVTAMSFIVLIWIVTLAMLDMLADKTVGMAALGKGLPCAALVSLFTFGTSICFRLMGIPMEYHRVASEKKQIAEQVLDRLVTRSENGESLTPDTVEQWMAPYYAVHLNLVLPAPDLLKPLRRRPKQD